MKPAIASEERIGDFIQTWTGKAVYVFDPREEEICIEDIAHSLSLMCRFTGHCNRLWSIGSHSLEVMKHLINMEREDLALMGLLHDASESYLADIPRPLKRWGKFGELYREAEHSLTTCIFRKFGVNNDGSMHPLVKLADNKALATEKRDLMNNFPGIVWENLPEPDPDVLVVTPPRKTERLFLSAFKRLTTPLAKQSK